ncbi:MAG: hypothetical protein KKB50_20550 [Planctomycetes bacterium]|nr:hypothetical protein [Planctomycetota bacterium]
MVDSVQETAPAPEAAAASVGSSRRPDLGGALRTFLGIDIAVRLFIWSTALALATAAYTALGAWPEGSLIGADLGQAWHWGQRLTGWVVLFNLIYVLELIVLRLPIPTPKEGRYPTTERKPNMQLLWSCLVAVLTKARYQAPFPGFLVFHFASLPPLVWLMGPIFGPRSKTCYVTDPQIIDPHLITLGRNVVIGFNTTVAGHYQERDAVVFKRTIIEDDVLVGGHAVIFGGVHIKAGAMIGAGAIVLPGTVVGPNEFWAGVPARKLRDLSPATAIDTTPQRA